MLRRENMRCEALPGNSSDNAKASVRTRQVERRYAIFAAGVLSWRCRGRAMRACAREEAEQDAASLPQRRDRWR